MDAATCCEVSDRKLPAFLIDNFLRRLFRPPARFLARYVMSGQTAADLGCGPGYYTLPMAGIVGPEGEVHAVDFDDRAIDRLRRKSDGRDGGGKIHAWSASASRIDFIETGSVDFVLAEGLLCCMKDHDGAVHQVMRILKPEGKAYLSVIKFGKKDDPRAVSGEEWNRILGHFRVLDGGESAVSRWALVGAQSDKNELEDVAKDGVPAGSGGRQ